MADFSAEISQVRREWAGIFKRKNCQPRILYLTKILFRNKGEKYDWLLASSDNFNFSNQQYSDLKGFKVYGLLLGTEILEMGPERETFPLFLYAHLYFLYKHTLLLKLKYKPLKFAF